MKTTSLFFLLMFLTACSQHVGYGIGVAGVSSSADAGVGTGIYADSETGIHGNVAVGTDIRL